MTETLTVDRWDAHAGRWREELVEVPVSEATLAARAADAAAVAAARAGGAHACDTSWLPVGGGR